MNIVIIYVGTTSVNYNIKYKQLDYGYNIKYKQCIYTRLWI